MRERRSTTRSSSAWPRASARPTACSGGPRRAGGRPRRRRSACSRPTAAPRRRRWPRGSSWCRAGASSYREHRARGDGPARRSCAARPSSCLVDELAHTNAPGRRARQALRGHRGRAGRRHRRASRRSTSSTSSRSTTSVAELTRRDACARRSPTACSARADEIVLIDLTPEALLDRLRAGKVYPAARIDAALNNFFRIENLAALREVALRQVAEEVEAKRIVTEHVGTRERAAARRRRRRPSASGCWRWSSPTRARSGSCAARGARRSGSARARHAVGAATRQRLTAEQERRSRRCARSPSVLGANLLVEESDDARRDGRARRRRARHHLHPARPLARGARPRAPARPRCRSARCADCPGVDVRIVADRALRHEPTP